MSIFSIGRSSTGTTSGNAASDVAAGSACRPAIMEIGVFLAAATASTFGLNRTTALGTRTTPVALLPEDPANLSGAVSETDCAVAWSVQPTFATSDMRLITLPATIGAGIVWTFPKGCLVAVSLSLAIVNRATNGNSTHYYVADE